MSDLVCIKEFSTAIEAEVIKGFLESMGVQAFVFSDDCGGTEPFGRFARLMVSIEQKDLAKKLIDESKKAIEN